MVLLVQKYGGSSLTDLSKLEYIAKKIKTYVQSGYQVVVVLSAMQGETDRLIELSKYMNQNTLARESDALLATGEQITTSMMAMALGRVGVKAKSLNAQQAGIYCDGKYSRAAITHIDEKPMLSLVTHGVVPVITGFQGVCEDGSVATLGRGGSDVTAVAVAAAIEADECQIFVDVHGVYTSDPKIVERARLIHSIPIDIMCDAAALGAKVIQKRAVFCAQRYRVPVRICSTYREGPGTMIDMKRGKESLEETKVFAITHQYNQLMLHLTGFTEQSMLDFLAHLHASGLELSHMINTNDKSQLDLLLILAETDYQLFKQVTEPWYEARSVAISEKLVKNKAKVSLVGHLLSRGLEATTEVFRICKREHIPIWNLQASDTSLSILVDNARVELLMRALHQVFVEGIAESREREVALVSESVA